MPERDFGELVPQAVFGDQGAWNALVNGLNSVALKVAKTYRLSDADAADVSQCTWLAVSQRLGALRDSTRLPGWLATTARRQALRIAAGRSGEAVLSGERDLVPSAESVVLRRERDRQLWAAVAHFPARQRRLLWLLAHRPELTYPEIGAELGISPGSVGPFRKRCLDKLRSHLLTDGFER